MTAYPPISFSLEAVTRSYGSMADHPGVGANLLSTAPSGGIYRVDARPFSFTNDDLSTSKEIGYLERVCCTPRQLAASDLA